MILLIFHIVVLYIRIQPDVIHSLSEKVSDFDGMQKCSIREFWVNSRPETVKIFRFLHPKHQLIANYALLYLKQKLPFDDKFDTNDTTTFYCSELPVHIIKTAFGRNIQADKSLIKFSSFMNPHYFREIPFMQKKSP